jgi:hypothetical protein
MRADLWLSAADRSGGFFARRLLPGTLVALDRVVPRAGAQRFVATCIGVFSRLGDGTRAVPTPVLLAPFAADDLAGLSQWLPTTVLAAFVRDAHAPRAGFLARLLHPTADLLPPLALAAREHLRFPGTYVGLDTQFVHDLVAYGLREAIAAQVDRVEHPESSILAYLAATQGHLATIADANAAKIDRCLRNLAKDPTAPVSLLLRRESVMRLDAQVYGRLSWRPSVRDRVQ